MNAFHIHFVHLIQSSFNKSIPLKNISLSYSISYTKSEYGDISPIDKIQKILLIKSISDYFFLCVNMYTNENIIMPLPLIVFNKYLRKNNDENILIYDPYFIKSDLDEYYNFLSLEIISGEAIVNFESPKSSLLEVIENKNKYSYIFRKFKASKILLKIKAN